MVRLHRLPNLGPNSDGVPPIRLVNGDKLVSMLEQLELGLIPRRMFELAPVSLSSSRSSAGDPAGSRRDAGS
jgi:hypothetical protein